MHVPRYHDKRFLIVVISYRRHSAIMSNKPYQWADCAYDFFTDAYILKLGYLTKRKHLKHGKTIKHLDLDEAVAIINKAKIKKSMVWIEKMPTGKHYAIIYFLRCKNFVKIGHTRYSVQTRLSQIQPFCPFPLLAEYAYFGHVKEEHEIHKTLSHLRVEFEWFKYNQEMRDFIAKLRKTTREAE